MKTTQMNKYQRLFALCELVIIECQKWLSLEQSRASARQRLLNCKLYKSAKHEKHYDPITLAPSEYYAAPKVTPYNEFHVSLGNGNNFTPDDESFCDSAAASLGMYSKMLPSNRYS